MRNGTLIFWSLCVHLKNPTRYFLWRF